MDNPQSTTEKVFVFRTYCMDEEKENKEDFDTLFEMYYEDAQQIVRELFDLSLYEYERMNTYDTDYEVFEKADCSKILRDWTAPTEL